MESITRRGKRFSSEIAQTIELDGSKWVEKGYVPIFGAPSWLVDRERGFKMCIRDSVNIDDPYCFDSYLSGWDPEAGASTYITRTYTFGVDIKF